MEKKTQKQPKDNGEEIKREQFDVFISYRGIDTIKIKKDSNNSNDSEKTYPIHSTSLARSIYLELLTEGFNAFYDGLDIAGEIFDIIRENRSRYYIILIANYSIKTIEKYHYDKVKETENSGKGNEEAKKGYGYNFAKELFLINNGIKNNEIDKKKVFLFRIGNCLDNENEVLSTLSDYGYTSFVSQNVEVISFPSNQGLSIKQLIDPNEKGKIRIEKANKFSYQKCKRISKIALNLVWPITIALCSFAVVLGFLGHNFNKLDKDYSALNNDFNKRLNEGITSRCGDSLNKLNDSLDRLNDKLARYENEFIVFAGGGTVQQYLQKRNGIDVNNYPFSKYVHIPSTIAWHLLWDDVYENEKRQYCPVVLSTGRIDTTGANIFEFTEKRRRRIATYELDPVPLKVQIVNNNTTKNTGRENSPITLDSLKQLLIKAKENNYAEYEIWTTSIESGTYLEYKKLLNDTLMVNLESIRNTILKDAKEIIFAKANTKTTDSVYRDFEERLKDHLKPMFNLDDIVNNQPGGRKDYSPEIFTKSPDNKLQIILANEQYYYQRDDSVRLPISNHAVVSGRERCTIPLYIYTIAKVKDNNELELLPEAKEFLERIGCNTEAQRTPNYTEDDKVTVIWPSVGK